MAMWYSGVGGWYTGLLSSKTLLVHHHNTTLFLLPTMVGSGRCLLKLGRSCGHWLWEGLIQIICSRIWGLGRLFFWICVSFVCAISEICLHFFWRMMLHCIFEQVVWDFWRILGVSYHCYGVHEYSRSGYSGLEGEVAAVTPCCVNGFVVNVLERNARIFLRWVIVPKCCWIKLTWSWLMR